jgi:hypothetical protein
MECISIESSFSDHNFSIPTAASLKFVDSENNACCRLIFRKIQENNDFNAIKKVSTTTQLVRHYLTQYF